MSKHEFVLNAQSRTDAGKGASRRLRKSNGVPAIIYGGDKAPANISLVHDDMVHATDNEAFFTSILTLNVDGTSESVIIKDMQRHPSKPRIMHADFQRVSADHALHVKVPLHFINEATAVGVKVGGGEVHHLISDLEISCLPKDLPEYIEVDIAGLDIGQYLHISDLKLPEGVTSIALSHGADSDLAVVSITAKKVAADEPAAEGGAEAPKE
jgi:large subunit ribosomal protein L25